MPMELTVEACEKSGARGLLKQRGLLKMGVVAERPSPRNKEPTTALLQYCCTTTVLLLKLLIPTVLLLYYCTTNVLPYC